MDIDVLIIGQGLAGSILAWELIKHGKKVVVIDNGEQNASLMSAGIINPITGQRVVKTQDVELFLPAARSYYAELSDYFGQQFVVDMPIRRIFCSQKELDHCRKRLTQSAYLPYLGELNAGARKSENIKTPFGFIDQKQTCRLLTTNLLQSFQQWLQANKAYRQVRFDHHSLLVTQQLNWRDLKIERIIFCEGHNGNQNPWFNWLPFQPAKGEILTMTARVRLPKTMLNFGHWLAPINENEIRLGATFEWQFSNHNPSNAGKTALLKSIKDLEIFETDYQVTDHDAGIRPCTEDRHPFIGNHPVNPYISIFNGFGTKGSLQIPWYAQRFCDFLINRQPLPAACDIQRYQSRFIPA